MTNQILAITLLSLTESDDTSCLHGFSGIIAAPVDLHPFTIFVSIIFIALGGGASGALNMWYESDLDSLMRRTRNRPIPLEKLQAMKQKHLVLRWLGYLL